VITGGRSVTLSKQRAVCVWWELYRWLMRWPPRLGFVRGAFFAFDNLFWCNLSSSEGHDARKVRWNIFKQPYVA